MVCALSGAPTPDDRPPIMGRRPPPEPPLLQFLRWLFGLISGEREDYYKGYLRSRSEVASPPPATTPKPSPPPKEPPPYVISPAFMSAAEARFDEVLSACVDDPHVRIHRKVRIADILQVVPGTPRWQHWFNRISSKHVDFLVCLGQQPIAVIELDDRSHNSPKRRARDEFVDEAYEAAGLPILHVRASTGYDPEPLAAFIAEAAYAAASRI